MSTFLEHVRFIRLIQIQIQHYTGSIFVCRIRQLDRIDAHNPNEWQRKSSHSVRTSVYRMCNKFYIYFKYEIKILYNIEFGCNQLSDKTISN